MWPKLGGSDLGYGFSPFLSDFEKNSKKLKVFSKLQVHDKYPTA